MSQTLSNPRIAGLKACERPLTTGSQIANLPYKANSRRYDTTVLSEPVIDSKTAAFALRSKSDTR